MSVKRSAPTSIDVCEQCRRPFVVPFAVLGFGPGHYLVELQCANCNWHDVRLHDEAALELLDRALDDGVEEIADALHTLELSRELEEVDTFAGALHAGAILPEDF